MSMCAWGCMNVSENKFVHVCMRQFVANTEVIIAILITSWKQM